MIVTVKYILRDRGKKIPGHAYSPPSEKSFVEWLSQNPMPQSARQAFVHPENKECRKDLVGTLLFAQWRDTRGGYFALMGCVNRCTRMEKKVCRLFATFPCQEWGDDDAPLENIERYSFIFV